eukprot:6213807-Pleurochrysis_carterae.AAC.2
MVGHMRSALGRRLDALEGVRRGAEGTARRTASCSRRGRRGGASWRGQLWLRVCADIGGRPCSRGEDEAAVTGAASEVSAAVTARHTAAVSNECEDAASGMKRTVEGWVLAAMMRSWLVEPALVSLQGIASEHGDEKPAGDGIDGLVP